MQRITSFSVDHDYIVPGMYISRIDGDITTYDLRTRKPNCGDYMDNITMHSMEHMLATFLRNSDAAEDVIPRPHGLPHGLLSAHALAEP